MNTNMAGFDGFQKSLRPCAFGKSSLSIGRVKKTRVDGTCRIISSDGHLYEIFTTGHNIGIFLKIQHLNNISTILQATLPWT